MCSAATHPGGGISGLPGHNAALQAINDVKNSFRQNNSLCCLETMKLLNIQIN